MDGNSRVSGSDTTGGCFESMGLQRWPCDTPSATDVTTGQDALLLPSLELNYLSMLSKSESMAREVLASLGT